VDSAACRCGGEQRGALLEGALRRDFIRTIQHKVAISALPPSTFRGSPAGLIAAARKFLRKLDLSQFAVSNPQLFTTRLDRATRRLQAALPSGAGTWGVARKSLNLFLRDAFYNTYLRDRFKLLRAETCFEVPLDGVVAKALRKRFGKALPHWRGVKYLTREVSVEYQAAAIREAQQMNLSPVHLDVYLWTIRDQSG
jgi:hypothetical protein